jgi:lipoyl(octanoyl) transferase
MQAPPHPSSVQIVTLRAAPYVPTWDVQRERAAAVGAGTAREALFLVEHSPVYTLGVRTDRKHLLFRDEELRAAGAEVVPVDRGGDVTWHGPGQITGYPILDLKTRGRDVHRHVRSLEQMLIDVVATYGIEARRAEGMPGVWVGNQKIAALGVKVSHGWITYHGFALNVCPDLGWYERIVPCGLHGFGVTSLAALLGREVAWEEAADRTQRAFEQIFSQKAT